MEGLQNHDLKDVALELIAAKNSGVLSPSIIVAEASDVNHQLHDYFDWDNNSAGSKFRLVQAQGLIRQWKGVIVRQATEDRRLELTVARRAQSTMDQRSLPGGGSELVENIMAAPDKRASMLKAAMMELKAVRHRFREIQELAGVWEALERVQVP